MKKAILWLTLLALCVPALGGIPRASSFGQEPRSNYVVKDGTAEWVAPAGVSMDAVWAATLKALMTMRWSTDLVEKASWKIAAHQAHGSFTTFGKDEADMPRVEITLIEGNAPTLLVRWYIAGSGLKFGWGHEKKKFYRKFFAALDEALELGRTS